MTPEEAVLRFMEGFAIPAYPTGSVPDQEPMPYLTYALPNGQWGGEEVSMQVDLWYRTESETEPNAKARELFDAIGLGGRLLACDGGGLWLKRGTPWCQNVSDGSGDDMVKRRYINIDIEYLIP